MGRSAPSTFRLPLPGEAVRVAGVATLSICGAAASAVAAGSVAFLATAVRKDLGPILQRYHAETFETAQSDERHVDTSPEEPDSAASQPLVSIVIPTLNEAAALPTTLRHVAALDPRPFQVIVADGGSTDGTCEAAQAGGAVLLRCGAEERGRARQMNAGAAEAERRAERRLTPEAGDERRAEAALRVPEGRPAQRGAFRPSQGLQRACSPAAPPPHVLCFLHADTLPPADLVQLLASALSDPATVCVGLVPLLCRLPPPAPSSSSPSSPAPRARLFPLLSLRGTAKTWLLALLHRPAAFLCGYRVLFGDQAMACRSKDFLAAGGFDARLPLLEDAELGTRLQGGAERARGGGGQEGQGKRGETSPNAPALATSAACRVRLLPRGVVTSARRFEEAGVWRASLANFVLCCAFCRGVGPEGMAALKRRLYSRDVR